MLDIINTAQLGLRAQTQIHNPSAIWLAAKKSFGKEVCRISAYVASPKDKAKYREVVVRATAVAKAKMTGFCTSLTPRYDTRFLVDDFSAIGKGPLVSFLICRNHPTLAHSWSSIHHLPESSSDLYSRILAMNGPQRLCLGMQLKGHFMTSQLNRV